MGAWVDVVLSLGSIRLRTAARKAARNQDWPAAVVAYRAYLVRRPRDVRGWEQLGHAAKEAGDVEAAVAAYGRALDLAPDAAHIWFHLSHACKRLGDRTAAINCCVQAAKLDPAFIQATEELVALGARDHVPQAISGGGVDGAGPVDRTGIDPSAGLMVYAPSRYDAYRRQIAILPPPGGMVGVPPADRITVVVDARKAMPVEVRTTLSSLLDQVDDNWRVIVHAPARISDHSVASLAAIDPRIRFVATDAGLPDIADAPRVLMMGAGTMLDRQAIAWFSFVAARTGCAAAYGDHDHCIDDWRTGRTFMRPAFQPIFDPDWEPSPEDRPAVVFVDRTRLPLTGWRRGDAWHVIRDAAAIGPVAHLPLLLASRKAIPAQAEQALPDPPLTEDEPARIVVPAQPGAVQRIQVVIQTRDQSAMLRAAIVSLRRRAERPDLLDITVVDNRSVETVTGRLLDRWRQRKVAAVLPLDEPFNWSRANNLAVEAGTAPLLLFLNNDTKMLTAGWDSMLRTALSTDDVGAVGATLLYPDHSIQHAGIIMGMGTGGPIHEGVGRPVEAGPGDRWRKSRSATAVTGAFLAMRRDVFTAIDGFDALNFAIAFNDIDLCLRVRAAGLRVVMASRIRVIHYESKTRGINAIRSQVAWDLDELGRMHDRWGSALFDDPAYNPHWTRSGQPFDGYRFPSTLEILRHIDLSSRFAPWRPVMSHDAPDRS